MTSELIRLGSPLALLRDLLRGAGAARPGPEAPAATARKQREGIRPPKFAKQFAVLDFEAEAAPVISMFQPPDPITLDAVTIGTRSEALAYDDIPWTRLAGVPRVSVQAHLVCQIFNWYEDVTWRGIRLADFLAATGLEVSETGYLVVHSRDGHYFETLSRDEAIDPRVLLVNEMNGAPLPHQYGGPVRLVVPFLQGYKSVKWVARIHAYKHDPVGIKRLLGQSKSAALGRAWLDRLSIVPAEGRPGDPAPERVERTD